MSATSDASMGLPAVGTETAEHSLIGWLFPGMLAVLTLIGAGLWAAWLLIAPARELSELSWFFLCH
jgi:hypothetical protein